jgi:hypothetical protein
VPSSAYQHCPLALLSFLSAIHPERSNLVYLPATSCSPIKQKHYKQLQKNKENDKTHGTSSSLANSRPHTKVLQPFSQNHNNHKDLPRHVKICIPG